MKFNYLFVVLLFLLGTSVMQGQKGNGSISDCTDLAVNQVCQTDGTVTLTIRVSNNTNFFVNFIHLSDGNGWNQGLPVNLAPQTSSNQTFTYEGATPLTMVCFTVRLFNPQIGVCCTREICIRVIDCPCGEIVNQDITCVPSNPNAYQYCFTVTNPPNSSNSIDELILLTNTPDICIDGNPFSTLLTFPAIPQGGSGQVCVTFTGCSSPLESGTDIDLTYLLLDTNDPNFCCHIGPQTVTTPCCDGCCNHCDDFNFHVDFSPPPNGNNSWSTCLISDFAGVIDFNFWVSTMPDTLQVRVNGNLVLQLTPSSNGAPPTATGSVVVHACDTVCINVIGNANQNSGWDLDVACHGGIEDPPYSTSGPFGSGTQRIAQDRIESLTVFPNPVRDVLNIRNENSEVNYESVRVMDNSGRTVLTQNMFGTDLQLNVVELPKGVYLLELVDEVGNKTIEKFIKAE